MSSETQYFVEYSKSNRSKCSFGKQCNDQINKGELRLGVHFEGASVPMTKYRHWRCVTRKIIGHIGSSDNLGGYENLESKDQKYIDQTFDDGCVKDGTEERHLAGKQAEKDAKAAEKQAEKDAKAAEKQAEKDAKAAEKQAEKDAKAAKKATKDTQDHSEEALNNGEAPTTKGRSAKQDTSSSPSGEEPATKGKKRSATAAPDGKSETATKKRGRKPVSEKPSDKSNSEEAPTRTTRNRAAAV